LLLNYPVNKGACVEKMFSMFLKGLTPSNMRQTFLMKHFGKLLTESGREGAKWTIAGNVYVSY